MTNRTRTRFWARGRAAAWVLSAGVFASTTVLAAPQGDTPENVNIDVLVVHTPGAATLYSGGIRTRIQHMLNVANQAYVDSDVGITLRLAAAVSVAYGDTPSSSTALTAIKNNAAPFGSVEAWRTQYGADMVVLMRKYNGDGYAGLGYVGGIGTGGNLGAYKRYMYSNVAINTADYVLAHELGHNMGLVHSRRQDPAGGTFHYSAGYGLQGVMVDIMAYGSAFSVGDAGKVYQFSNPANTVNGNPLGVARTNTSTGSDAAASLNAVRDQLAGFYASKQLVTSRVGDFGGDSRSDLFRNDPDAGSNHLWVSGTHSAPADGLGADLEHSSEPNAQLIGSGDFDGDGTTDVLFRGKDGTSVEGWLLGSGSPSVVDYPAMYGAYWVVAGTGDLNADGKDDVVWRNQWDGTNRAWFMNGADAPSVQTLVARTPVAWRIDAVGDFDEDGKVDLFWRHGSTGANSIWLMNGATIKAQGATLAAADLAVRVAGASDFDGDGDADVLMQHKTTGVLTLWAMNGLSVTSRTTLPGKTTLRCVGLGDLDGDGLADDLVWNDAATEDDVVWTMQGGVAVSQRSLKTGRDLLDDLRVVGDFDGDGKSDLLWRNAGSGANELWKMNGATVTSETALDPHVSATASLMWSGDFDGDGKDDVLWVDAGTRLVRVWLMNGATVKARHNVGTLSSATLGVVAIGDLSGDGKDDLVLRNGANGANQLWVMNPGVSTTVLGLPALADLTWNIVGAADMNGDSKADLFWRNHSTGKNTVWFMNGATRASFLALTALADTRWRVQGLVDANGDGQRDVLWRHLGDGRNSLWLMNGATVLGTSGATTTLSDLKWKVEGLGDFNGDGKSDVLWEHTGTGDRHVWLMNGLTVTSNTRVY